MPGLCCLEFPGSCCLEGSNSGLAIWPCTMFKCKRNEYIEVTTLLYSITNHKGYLFYFKTLKTAHNDK